jgi:hypothetical protein
MRRVVSGVSAVVDIRPERADHPQVVALLDALDRYLGELYEPEANHIRRFRSCWRPK